ncbi:putative receptor-like protein kinase-like [Capsicum annuum]|nr:putative receptor-like protein kinase-like [Capsicum annuum]
MDKLTNLRLLDMLVADLKIINKGFFLKLPSIKMLNLSHSSFGATSFDEISSLRSLPYLFIKVDSSSFFNRDYTWMTRLKGFLIEVDLYLNECMGLRKFIAYNTFNGLKLLNIQSCSCSYGSVEGGSGQFDFLPNMECLDLHFVKNLKRVSDSVNVWSKIFKLRQLDISDCPSLTCLFNDGGACSVPKHLEEITIRYCRDLVELYVQCSSSDQDTLVNSEIPRVWKLRLY